MIIISLSPSSDVKHWAIWQMDFLKSHLILPYFPSCFQSSLPYTQFLVRLHLKAGNSLEPWRVFLLTLVGSIWTVQKKLSKPLMSCSLLFWECLPGNNSLADRILDLNIEDLDWNVVTARLQMPLRQNSCASVSSLWTEIIIPCRTERVRIKSITDFIHFKKYNRAGTKIDQIHLCLVKV